MLSPMRLQSYIDTAQLHQQKSDDAETQSVRSILAGAKVRRLCTNRRALERMNHIFSHKIDTWTPTDQHRTGRCWIHASLNVLKARWMHKHPNLELSPCYISFFDKLERANTVLQSAKHMREVPMSHREMVSLLTDVGTDGGQWNMFVQLVEKYGVVPKWSMDDTLSDKDSNDVNSIIADLIVAAVFSIRRSHASRSDAVIQRCLENIYHVLYVHFGEPPTLVNLRWSEKGGGNNEERGADERTEPGVRNGDVVDKGWVRPQELFRSICPESLDGHYLMLCHDPRYEYGQLFCVEGVTSAVEGDSLTYLNVSSRTLMDAVFHSVVHHKLPVWFTCDVDKQFHRGRGVMDSELYMPERLYRLDKGALTISKRERLECRRSMPTHAMVFTGVDVERDPQGQPHISKWRVENSWGKEGARGDAKGFIAMSNEWFHEYVFQVVIDVRVLDRRMVAYAQSASPIMLKPWDVFGTVAR